MVPYTDIDSNAPFSVALGQYYPAASYIVSIGACAGTFNSAFADLYAMSRLMVVMSRCRLIPAVLVSRCMRLLFPSVCFCSGLLAVSAEPSQITFGRCVCALCWVAQSFVVPVCEPHAVALVHPFQARFIGD